MATSFWKGGNHCEEKENCLRSVRQKIASQPANQTDKEKKDIVTGFSDLLETSLHYIHVQCRKTVTKQTDLTKPSNIQQEHGV